MDCNQGIETLKRSQPEIQMELKHPIVQLENTMENLIHRIHQAEESILSIKDKKVYLSKYARNMKNFKMHRKRIHRTFWYHKK